MRASGEIRLGDQTFNFDPQTSFGVLDWGRVVLTYDNILYRGSASGLVNGKTFGFNIGYGLETQKPRQKIWFSMMARRIS